MTGSTVKRLGRADGNRLDGVVRHITGRPFRDRVIPIGSKRIVLLRLIAVPRFRVLHGDDRRTVCPRLLRQQRRQPSFRLQRKSSFTLLPDKARHPGPARMLRMQIS